MHRGVVQSVEHQSPKLGVQGSSPCAPAKTKRSPNGDLFVLKVDFSARLEGEAVLNDSPVGCQIRGKALPAGKGVLAPLPSKGDKKDLARKSLDFSRLFSFFGRNFYV